jgi:hypothetical protein
MGSREELVDFLDRHVFDPILNASPNSYPERLRDDLQYVQDRTQSEKDRYHQYGSASEIVRMYKDDLKSDNAKPVNRKLHELGLPRLVDVKEEFEKKAA